MPDKEFFEKCTAISLPLCKISKLPEVFELPNVTSFHLLTYGHSLKVPDRCFSRMKELKVLNLKGLHLSPFPSSLQFLENLQTLCLDGCVLQDVAAIGELKRLQVLSFNGSNMVQLPPEIGKLTRFATFGCYILMQWNLYSRLHFPIWSCCISTWIS